MRYPRRRRPTRVHRWWGYVTDMDDEDTVGTVIVADGHKMPDLYAEFGRDLFDADTRPGTTFTLYIHRRGRKTRFVLRTIKRRWTEVEIAAIIRDADKLAAGWLR